MVVVTIMKSVRLQLPPAAGGNPAVADMLNHHRGCLE